MRRGRELERMRSDNSNEFRGSDFTSTLEQLGARHTRIPADIVHGAHKMQAK
jgi:hypothetical protein